MDWNYINGFFDADGSISLIKKHPNRKRSITLYFSNSERNILESIQAFILKETSIKGHLVSKKTYKENHSPQYDLRYSDGQAFLLVPFLKSIHPKKAHRLEVAKRYKSVTPRNGKYTEEMLEKRNQFVTDFFYGSGGVGLRSPVQTK